MGERTPISVINRPDTDRRTTVAAQLGEQTPRGGGKHMSTTDARTMLRRTRTETGEPSLADQARTENPTADALAAEATAYLQSQPISEPGTRTEPTPAIRDADELRRLRRIRNRLDESSKHTTQELHLSPNQAVADINQLRANRWAPPISLPQREPTQQRQESTGRHAAPETVTETYDRGGLWAGIERRNPDLVRRLAGFSNGARKFLRRQQPRKA